jgi:putative transposase
MRLVEQHVIKRGDPRYQCLDEAAFASKNLWNAANYLVRQSFIFGGVYLTTRLSFI